MQVASIITLVKSSSTNYASVFQHARKLFSFVIQTNHHQHHQPLRFRHKSSANLRAFNKKFDKMIRVKFNDEENRVLISLRCKLMPPVSAQDGQEAVAAAAVAAAVAEREFNLNRSQDEEIGATFEKLYANFQKFASPKMNKLAKKQKTSQSNQEEKLEIPEQPPPIYLYDTENNPVDAQTKNKNAWLENYTLKLQDQTFRVCINLPTVTKISMPKLMVAGLPAVVKIECDNNEDVERNSMFTWYASESCMSTDEENKSPNTSTTNTATLPTTTEKKKPKQFDLSNVKWKLIDEGKAKRMCVLGADLVGRLVRVECMPNDGKRDGLAVEAVSTSLVVSGPELDKMAMSERHKLTANTVDSDSIRIMSYNILASCYSDTAAAREELFAHCPLEYLDFKYRRPLLLHEIKNYNCDIMFFQECEKDFFRDEILTTLGSNFEGRIKIKGEGHEGEAIAFRKDRFRLVKSHDIMITEQLMKNPLFETLWSNISRKNAEYQDFISKRTTVLQVLQLECLEHPGFHLLLANSHFFFHPEADFLRMLQAIVSAKYLENLKKELLANDTNGEIKKLGVLFGGDLNSDPTSKAFKYLFSQVMPREEITDDELEYLEGYGDELCHSLDLSIYADFLYTNYVVAFQDTIDHLFYETNALELTRVIPMPPHEKIIEFIALPSKYVPSDHLPIIFEFKLKPTSPQST